MFIIEFRSGSCFTRLDADHGGPREQARRFATREEADAFGDEHEWIWFNGGTVVEVPE
jgi:hypothetical protein